MSLTTRPRHLAPYRRYRSTGERVVVKFALFASVIFFSVFMGLAVGVTGLFAANLFAPVIGALFLFAFWALPDSDIDLSRPARFALMSYFAASLVWPSYLAVALPGLPWITPTRAIFFILVTCLVLQLAQSKALRSETADVFKVSKIFLVCICLHLASRFISAPFSPTPLSTIPIVIDNVLLWGLPLLSAIWLVREEGDRKAVISIIIACTAAGILLALGEYAIKKPIWADHIPSFLKVDSALLESYLGDQARSGDNLYRVRGVFGVSVYYAQYLALVAPFFLHAIFTSRKLWQIAILSTLMMAFVFVAWTTNSRTATVGMIIGTLCYVGLAALRRFMFPRHRADLGSAVPLFAGVGAAVMFLVLIMSSHRLRVMTIGGAQHADSDKGRNEQWSRALDLLLANPLGHGAEQAGPLAGTLSHRGFWILDNGWINLMVDYGVLGAGGILIAFLYLCIRLVRIYFSEVGDKLSSALPLAVSLLVFLFTLVTVSAQVNYPMVFLLAGVSLVFIQRVENAKTLSRA